MSGKASIYAFLALIAVGFGIQARAGGWPPIQIVEYSINYPAPNVSDTVPFDINDLGNLSIQVALSDGSFWVGTRINGQYSALSQPPGTDSVAGANDINNFNVVIGDWYNGSTFRGFVLYKGTYTSFDVNVSGANSTVPWGINDYGVVSGYYGAPAPSAHDQAFSSDRLAGGR